MRMRVAEPVMVEDFQQLGFFQGGDRLAGLIVIHQDDLQARRVEDIPLAGHAEVKSIFVHHPEIIILHPAGCG